MACGTGFEKSVNGFMLDTNAFDAAAKMKLPANSFAGVAVYSTHVQRDELSATKNEAIKLELLGMYGAVDAEQLATETAVWDDSRWDEARWSWGDGLYERLLTEIIALDASAKKKSAEAMNQSRDARIAETAIRNRLTLVTNDIGLAAATKSCGGRAISLAAFLSSLPHRDSSDA
jgi:predicted nucleic acid-binding protein